MTEYRCTWWEDTGSNSPFDALAINTDPDLVELVTAGLGIAIGVGTEWFYALARKLGWER